MVQDPRLKRPKRPSVKTKPRVWLPYSGPELVEMGVENVVPISKKTTAEVASICKKCGSKRTQLVGVEEKSHRWNAKQRMLVPVHVPRAEGRGLYVEESKLGPKVVFRPEPFEEFLICTDRFRDLILAEGPTNIDFLEYGEVV